MKAPGNEVVPDPPEGFRVIFTELLMRSLSVPIHEFLRGLLIVYGIQLHHLTPNSILHITIFITLCECFLGIHPHWGLWKLFFVLRRNNTRDTIDTSKTYLLSRTLLLLFSLYLLCFWIKLTRTNAVISRIALVSSLCAETR